MVFGNPAALWILLIIILIFGLGYWGWKVKVKENIAGLFKLNGEKIKKSQVRKYIIAGFLLLFLISAFALPQLLISLPGGGGKTGEVILMVDVTRSMAAQKSLNSPNNLERVKPILYEIIDEFPEAEFWLFHFTDLARSLTPPLTKENFPYLKSSIARVLNMNSVPGSGSDLAKSLSSVLDKIPEEKEARLIVVFSDGEPFEGMSYSYSGIQGGKKEPSLEEAIGKARQKKIKIITVGVGEKEGATIPLFDEKGKFTGEYAKNKGEIYVAYLKEEALREIAVRTGGKYFFETDYQGIIDCIGSNLVSKATDEQKDHQDISYLFLIPVAVLWMIFARYYFK